jgi:hypothetical protein
MGHGLYSSEYDLEPDTDLKVRAADQLAVLVGAAARP